MQTRVLAIWTLGVVLPLGTACSGRTSELHDAAGGWGGSGEAAGADAMSGSAGTSAGSAGTSAGSGGSASLAGGGGAGGAAQVPVKHRAAATPCDETRSSVEPNVPDMQADYIKCHSHADCTEGKNGRCTPDGHGGGWKCTYDLCSTDSDCPANGSEPQVCACEGGFPSDNNVCLSTGCRVDADCGDGGYCSPTLGSCGNYLGVVGYVCHTPDDECTDDADCSGLTAPFGNPYCAFQPTVGHWQCSTMQCAG